MPCAPFPHSTAPGIPAILGPTAVGKTAAAVALARRWPIEIVSADSMQVYRGIDVGAAKPSPEEIRAAPHHLIDVADPSEAYDLARFLRDAAIAIDDIRRRGKIPLIVGGTGLYIKGMLEGIFDVSSRDASLRRALERRMSEEGAPALHRLLRHADPAAANRLSPNDSQRIARALEVFATTGRPLSAWHGDPGARRTPARPLRLVVLVRPRAVLNRRIADRVNAMLGAGWIEEVERLLRAGVADDAHCFKALGYRWIVRAVRGEISPSDLAEPIAQETRQFAKRQMTWFRALPGAVWLDLEVLGECQARRLMEEALFPGVEM